jgi:serine/threonine protein kinase
MNPECLLERNEVRLGSMFAKGAEGLLHRGLFNAKLVAVKRLVVKAERLKKLRCVEDICGEANLMHTLAHKNVVTFYGCCLESSHILIVTEMCKGSLQALVISETPIQFQTAMQVVSQIADAMAYLHSEGVIHRDLKPANVLIDSCDQIKLTDFGIARKIQKENVSMTLMKGTPYYMAPEMMGSNVVSSTGRNDTEDNFEHSYAVDVYSFAMLTFAVFTQQHPFSDNVSMHDLFVGVPNGLRPDFPPTGVSQAELKTFVEDNRCSHLTPEIVALVNEAWAMDPAKRPPFTSIVDQLSDVVRSAAHLEEGHVVELTRELRFEDFRDSLIPLPGSIEEKIYSKGEIEGFVPLKQASALQRPADGRQLRFGDNV